MGATNGSTLLDADNVIHKASSDFHKGKFWNEVVDGSADIESKGGWLGMVADATGRSVVKPVYCALIGGIALRVYFKVTCTKLLSSGTYWPVQYTEWIPFGVRLSSVPATLTLSANMITAPTPNGTASVTTITGSLGPDGDCIAQYGFNIILTPNTTSANIPVFMGYVDVAV